MFSFVWHVNLHGTENVGLCYVNVRLALTTLQICRLAEHFRNFSVDLLYVCDAKAIGCVLSCTSTLDAMNLSKIVNEFDFKFIHERKHM